MRIRFNVVNFFLFCYLSCFPQKQLGNVFDSEPHYAVSYDVIIDSIGKSSFKDIISQFEDKKFKHAFIGDSTNMVSRGKVHWLRFEITNKTKESIILSFNKLYSSVTLYIPTGKDSFVVKKNAVSKPYLDRDFYFSEQYFLVPAHHSKQTYYAKIESDLVIGLGLEMYSVSYAFRFAIVVFLFFAFFFGIYFIIFVYNIILFARIKEIVYFHYSMYIFFLAVYALLRWGFIDYLFKGITYDYVFLTIPFFIATCFQMLYAQSFLDTRHKFPVFHQLITLTIFSRILIFIIGWLFKIEIFHDARVDFLLLLVPFSGGIYAWQQGYKPARFFLFSFFCIFLGYFHNAFGHFIYTTKIESILITWKNDLGFFAASVFEIILFSVALSERFRMLKTEKEMEHLQTIALQEESLKKSEENQKLKDQLNYKLNELVDQKTIELKLANAEIAKMNQLLLKDNVRLEENVKEISEARVMQRGVTFEEFKAIYPDQESCLSFISELKWENSYKCKKCGYGGYSLMPNKLFARRCNRCRYVESAILETIFNGMKFPIQKAFYILFMVNSGKNYSNEELAEKLDLRIATCWKFKQKVLSVIEKNKRKSKDGWSHLILDF